MSLRENGTAGGKGHLQIWEQVQPKSKGIQTDAKVRSSEYCNFMTNLSKRASSK